MSATALRAGGYLHHLKLASPQPDRLARFYDDAMQMPARKVGTDLWLCEGPSRRSLIGPGEAGHLDFAAFACRDAEGLEELREKAEAEGLPLVDLETPLFAPGYFAVQDPDARKIVFGLALQPDAPLPGRRGPLQHITFATQDLEPIEAFYADKLGFAISDRVRDGDGRLTTVFMRSNHEHHTLAAFLADHTGLDHHSYEAGEWDTIRDWADHFSRHGIELMWGPGRHGPGNNLFIFIADPDGNWIEVSAELEVIHDRPVKEWPHGPHTLNLWGGAIMRI